MNRMQFMEELEKLLMDIPDAEREEALDYYENYFDDAGKEKEEEIIRELGSPMKVALSIKHNLTESNEEYAEYTECGYEDTRARQEGDMPDAYTAVGHRRTTNQRSAEENTGGSGNSENMRWRGNAKLILLLILMVFLAPFLKGIIGGVLGGIAGLFVVVFCLPVVGIIVVGALTLAFAVGGVAIIASAIPVMITNVAVGILLLGLGFFFLAAVFLGMLLIRWIAVNVIPGFLRGLTDACKKILRKLKRGGAGI